MSREDLVINNDQSIKNNWITIKLIWRIITLICHFMTLKWVNKIDVRLDNDDNQSSTINKVKPESEKARKQLFETTDDHQSVKITCQSHHMCHDMTLLGLSSCVKRLKRTITCHHISCVKRNITCHHISCIKRKLNIVSLNLLTPMLDFHWSRISHHWSQSLDQSISQPTYCCQIHTSINFMAIKRDIIS